MNLDAIIVPEEIKQVILRRRSLLGEIGRESFLSDWETQDSFRHGTSWHLPSEDLVATLVEYGPILSVGAGYGYTESLALEKGADLIATDIAPNDRNQWCREGKLRCKIEEMDAVEAVQHWPERNVFMAWPPYDTPMAHEVAEAMLPGRILIYVGEGESGCTGDYAFFKKLDEDFEEIAEIGIASWSGIYDRCQVYKKIR
jgi:hypothetical protein